jgi:hypothetical protein
LQPWLFETIVVLSKRNNADNWKENKMNKVSYLRAEAKKFGLTFKAVNVTLNGNQAYKLFNRSTGQSVGSMTTIACAFDDQHHTNYFAEHSAL